MQPLSAQAVQQANQEVTANRARLAQLCYPEDRVLPGEESCQAYGPLPYVWQPPLIYCPPAQVDWQYQSTLSTWRSPGIYQNGELIRRIPYSGKYIHAPFFIIPYVR